jgi:hypothetical protein
MREGLVSTIIPVFNRPRLLAEAVDSVLAQTYRPIELIIVDDGSTDETPLVIERFAAKHPGVVHGLRKRNGGCPQARNAGVAVASGEFIQFLDSDDLLAPEKFAMQVAALREHPECGVSYCYTREYPIGDPLPPQPARRTAETHAQLFPALLAGRIWGFPSPLFRAAVVREAGPFRDARTFADWEFECRVAAAGVGAHHCQSFLAETRLLHRAEGRRNGAPVATHVRDAAQMHALILEHAQRAGVNAADLEVFAPRLFAAARQCASVGLDAEAQRLLRLALSISSDRARRTRIHVYSAAGRAIGWQALGRASEGIERHLPPLWRRPAAFARRWRRRASMAAADLANQPVRRWPRRLHQLWTARPSRALASARITP